MLVDLIWNAVVAGILLLIGVLAALELNEHATAQRETLRAGYARRGRSGRGPF